MIKSSFHFLYNQKMFTETKHDNRNNDVLIHHGRAEITCKGLSWNKSGKPSLLDFRLSS